MVAKPLSTLEIIQAPDSNVWVDEGKNTSLVCTSNQRWQWCYWERDTFNNKTVYQIGSYIPPRNCINICRICKNYTQVGITNHDLFF